MMSERWLDTNRSQFSSKIRLSVKWPFLMVSMTDDELNFTSVPNDATNCP